MLAQTKTVYSQLRYGGKARTGREDNLVCGGRLKDIFLACRSGSVADVRVIRQEYPPGGRLSSRPQRLDACLVGRLSSGPRLLLFVNHTADRQLVGHAKNRTSSWERFTRRDYVRVNCDTGESNAHALSSSKPIRAQSLFDMPRRIITRVVIRKSASSAFQARACGRTILSRARHLDGNYTARRYTGYVNESR